MSDRSAVMMVIGGPIAKGLIEQLVDEASDTSFDDWEKSAPTKDDIRGVIKAGKTLCVCDTQASGGLLHDLEDFCHKHKLSYVCYRDGHYAYGPVVDWWAPGMTAAGSADMRQDQNIPL